ncbi:AAA family ATPase [Catellatospora coxensis]|nr:AAA family ATPase [Catellatospora coxensis]
MTDHEWPEGTTDQRPDPPAPLRRATPLDWSTFLEREPAPVDFHAGKLMVRGQQITLVGEGKAGKSLFTLDWACHMASGAPFLGDQARAPVRVLYIDMENPDDDILERLLALGATPETLTDLVYLSFPLFRPLNTAEGGADLMAAVEEYRPDVVILDTISRMITGKENDTEPWLALYRHTLMPLKARKISSIRLDHFGKDTSRGARGNSAKTQDVDGVWELLPAERGSNLLRLTRTFTRSGKGHGELLIRRHGELLADDRWKPGGTWHAIADDSDRHTYAPDPLGGFRPAARRVMRLLATTGTGMTVQQIGDALADQPDGPLQKRTIQDALKSLSDAGLLDEIDPHPGKPTVWAVSTL